MREIKFRGKSDVEIGEKIIQVGEWVYGGIAFDEDRVWIDTPYLGQIIVDRETVGQFTGLKDKNGVEIYEGDIIKVRVRRLSSSYGSWWQERNKNHGWTGDFVYLKVVWKDGDNWNNKFGCFDYETLPITKIQVKEIEKPRGKEKNKQTVDYLNFKVEECEVIGNIYENPELLEVENV